MNRFRVNLALKAIEAQLYREAPELAAALLSFGTPWQSEAVRRRERRVLAAALCALGMLFMLMFSCLWGPPTS